jgi:hypothetical protein
MASRCCRHSANRIGKSKRIAQAQHLLLWVMDSRLLRLGLCVNVIACCMEFPCCSSLIFLSF